MVFPIPESLLTKPACNLSNMQSKILLDFVPFQSYLQYNHAHEIKKNRKIINEFYDDMVP